jgi:hypothetical protein
LVVRLSKNSHRQNRTGKGKQAAAAMRFSRARAGFNRRLRADVLSGKMANPTFKDGLATNYVTDTVLKSSKTLRREKVKKVK